MSKVPTIIPITDLRQDAATVLRRLRESREPVVITQRGRAAAVMMGVETYERSEHDRELLRLLARGAKELSVGRDTASTLFSPRRTRCWPSATGDGPIHAARPPAVSLRAGVHSPA